MSKMSYENKKYFGGRFKIFINIITILLTSQIVFVCVCVVDVGSRHNNFHIFQVKINAKNIVNEKSR